MRYKFDHDFHIHSELSLCSGDPAQNPTAILEYAKANGLSKIILTDHFWDAKVSASAKSGFYAPQNLEHVKKSLPLPKCEGIEFLFGCETDLDRSCILGIAPESYDEFAFIIIPTTHLHMGGFTCRGDEDAAERAKLWVERLDAVLDMPLPFHKVGIAHLTACIMPGDRHIEALRRIPDAEYHRIFARAARCGVGIELNFNALELNDNTRDIDLNPFRIAKAEGCKFYIGSDAHSPSDLAAEKANAELIIDLLELDESDKFILK